MNKKKFPLPALVLLILGLLLANGTALLSNKVIAMTDLARGCTIGAGIGMMIVALIVQQRMKFISQHKEKKTINDTRR